MAVLLREAVKWYRYIFNDLADPRVKTLPLMDSPMLITTIVATYLIFVQKVGPAIMASRPPFQLRRVLQIYNLLQIVINSYIFYMAWTVGYGSGGTYSWHCEPLNKSNDEIGTTAYNGVHLYFMVKVIDLLDTIFFVLRKKRNQITFLHVYHHAGMAINCWLVTKFAPGGHIIFVGLVNSAVHAAMYSYYLYSSLDWVNTPNVRWKKHITQMQILQFLYLSFHMGKLFIRNPCNFPMWVIWLFFPQNLLVFILFLNFYIKTYVLSNRKPTGNEQKAK